MGFVRQGAATGELCARRIDAGSSTGGGSRATSRLALRDGVGALANEIRDPIIRGANRLAKASSFAHGQGDRCGSDPRCAQRQCLFHLSFQTSFFKFFVSQRSRQHEKFGLPVLMDSDNPVPRKIMAYVSIEGKESVFTSKVRGLHKTAKAYHAEKSDRDTVRRDLEKSGFEIVAESALGLSVHAEPGLFEDLTGGQVRPRERLMGTTNGGWEYITCLDIVGKNQPATLAVGRAKSKALKVDGIILETPRQLHGVFPSPIPPGSPKYHLRVPNDVATVLSALPAHQQGIRGDGVEIVMPDLSCWMDRTANGDAKGFIARTG